MVFLRSRLAPGLTLAALAVATACDDPLAVPEPIFAVQVDTIDMAALSGTAIGEPSGFDVARNAPARTDRLDEPFDFAFDIDSLGNAEIFTTGALGLNQASAIQVMDRAFAEIREAPLDDYLLDSTVTVVAETVFVVRSRPSGEGCFFLGALPRYGKFRVLAVDGTTRRLTLESVVNRNCGLRVLEPDPAS